MNFYRSKKFDISYAGIYINKIIDNQDYYKEIFKNKTLEQPLIKPNRKLFLNQINKIMQMKAFI